MSPGRAGGRGTVGLGVRASDLRRVTRRHAIWNPDNLTYMTTFTRYIPPYPMPCHMGSFTEYMWSCILYTEYMWSYTAARVTVTVRVSDSDSG